MTSTFEGQPSKQGLNFNQNKGPHLGSRYIIYIYSSATHGEPNPKPSLGRCYNLIFADEKGTHGMKIITMKPTTIEAGQIIATSHDLTPNGG